MTMIMNGAVHGIGHREIGQAMGILALLGVAMGLPQAAPQTASTPGLTLGSKESCTRYSGLPSEWGQNRRAGMIRLQGGTFTLGTKLGYEDERPEIKTKVAGFWIDQTEVTVAQFASFVKATGYVTTAEQDGSAVVFHPPSAEELQQRDYAWWQVIRGANWRHPTGPSSSASDNLPVTLVTFADAEAYAHWLGRELPSEIQWEYAGKAGKNGPALENEPRDTAGKPIANFWQGPFPVSNSAEDGFVGLSPVGCFAGNDFQLYDMRGNAWEQTRDAYRESHETGTFGTALGVQTDRPDRLMVVKGGSHLCGRDFCVRYRASAREAHEANLPISHIGFRTVLVE